LDEFPRDPRRAEKSKMKAILVVERNPELGRMITESLEEQMQCAVDRVESGAAALERISAKEFSLLVLDGDLPGNGSEEVLKKWKHPWIPVQERRFVVLISVDGSGCRTRFGLPREFPLLEKPFLLEALLDHIRALISG